MQNGFSLIKLDLCDFIRELRMSVTNFLLGNFTCKRKLVLRIILKFDRILLV